jgi:hypothetical protein
VVLSTGFAGVVAVWARAGGAQARIIPVTIPVSVLFNDDLIGYFLARAGQQATRA